MMSEHRYGVHDCPNGLYYLRDVTDHSVYVHRNYGKLYSEYEEDIELVSTLLNELADKVDEQQSTIDKLEQRDYYNQSERYKILGRAIELTINYIANSNEEHYDIGALITEFEKELLDNDDE